MDWDLLTLCKLFRNSFIRFCENLSGGVHLPTMLVETDRHMRINKPALPDDTEVEDCRCSKKTLDFFTSNYYGIYNKVEDDGSTKVESLFPEEMTGERVASAKSIAYIL